MRGIKQQIDRARLSLALLGHIDGHVLIAVLRVCLEKRLIVRIYVAVARVLRAVEKQDPVRVLLDLTGGTQLRHGGHLALRAAAHLRQRNHRYAQIHSQFLERLANISHAQIVLLELLARAHQLQIVHDQHVQLMRLLQPPRLDAQVFHSAHLEQER